jgi:hypothetical protein
MKLTDVIFTNTYCSTNYIPLFRCIGLIFVIQNFYALFFSENNMSLCMCVCVMTQHYRAVMGKLFWEGAKEKRKNFRWANVNY